jgi:hypothetical protein
VILEIAVFVVLVAAFIIEQPILTIGIIAGNTALEQRLVRVPQKNTVQSCQRYTAALNLNRRSGGGVGIGRLRWRYAPDAAFCDGSWIRPL